MKSRQEFNSDAEWWEYYRDYSAAMALQGHIASWAGIPETPKAESLAKKSVEFADALIEELNKTK